MHDNDLLDSMHWSEEHGAYLDYGLHTDAVILQKPPFNPDIPPEQRSNEKVRKVLREPTLQYVNQVGYISKLDYSDEKYRRSIQCMLVMNFRLVSVDIGNFGPQVDQIAADFGIFGRPEAHVHAVRTPVSCQRSFHVQQA